MSVVERLKEFAEATELERSCLVEALGSRIDESWPESGDLKFDQVRIRYRKDLKFVLKGLSFEVKDGEKVAIIGRTGGGKSTIFQAIMRLLEIEADDEDQHRARDHEMEEQDRISDLLEKSDGEILPNSGNQTNRNKNGEISISGIDISMIPLARLRSSLGMITQEPILLGETVREAIDPFNEFSDREIITGLQKFGDFFISKDLKNHKNKAPTEELIYNLHKDFLAKNLGEEVETNLSLGASQLLCLVRMILRKPKIILLDEPTSSLDKKSQELVQQVLKEDFEGVTTIAIAHRLETLVDFDRVLVLKDGRIEREGTPEQMIMQGVHTKEAKEVF